MNTRKLIAYSLLLSASVLLPASCDGGMEAELATEPVVPLPEGRYPLRFTATQEGNDVQTRVAEDAAEPKRTLWSAGTDRIGVSIGTDGAVGRYLLTAADGSAMTAEQAVYWQDRNEAYIHGWFPATTDALPKTADSSIDLSNQASGSNGHLQFDFMQAQSAKKYQYNSTEPIALPFKHRMAKMSITLKSSDVLDLTDAKVEIYGYTSCTLDKGNVTAGTAKVFITACRTDASRHVYRAMVAPIEESALDGNFIKVTLRSGKSYFYKTGRKLEANMLYSYTVDVQKGSLSPGNAEDMKNIKGTVTIKGDGTETNNPITVTDNATVTLKDVKIKVTSNNTPAIRVQSNKKLTLKADGNNNSLEAASNGGIALEDGASIVIEGNGIGLSKLVVKAGKTSGEKTTVGIGASFKATCGDIEIKNITLEVAGGNDSYGHSAAIGTHGGTGNACGDITITDSHITATSGDGAAAIGAGYNYEANTKTKVGNITISGSTIIATIKPYPVWSETPQKDYYGACIGLCTSYTGATYECGTITITCDDETAFLNNLKYQPGSYTSYFGYKIGKGAKIGNGGTVIFSGGTINSTSFTDGYGSFAVNRSE